MLLKNGWLKCKKNVYQTRLVKMGSLLTTRHSAAMLAVLSINPLKIKGYFIYKSNTEHFTWQTFFLIQVTEQ